MPLYSSQQSYDLFVNGDLIFEKNIKLSEEAYDLLKNTITIENKRLDLDKIFEHPFFKKGKGLSIEKFPDYNNKDYMTKIAKLTSEFQIKPMIRKTIKNVKKNRKKRKKRKNSSSYSNSSSNSSSSYYENSEESSYLQKIVE